MKNGKLVTLIFAIGFIIVLFLVFLFRSQYLTIRFEIFEYVNNSQEASNDNLSVLKIDNLELQKLEHLLENKNVLYLGDTQLFKAMETQQNHSLFIISILTILIAISAIINIVQRITEKSEQEKVKELLSDSERKLNQIKFELGIIRMETFINRIKDPKMFITNAKGKRIDTTKEFKFHISKAMKNYLAQFRDLNMEEKLFKKHVLWWNYMITTMNWAKENKFTDNRDVSVKTNLVVKTFMKFFLDEMTDDQYNDIKEFFIKSFPESRLKNLDLEF